MSVILLLVPVWANFMYGKEDGQKKLLDHSFSLQCSVRCIIHTVHRPAPPASPHQIHIQIQVLSVLYPGGKEEGENERRLIDWTDKRTSSFGAERRAHVIDAHTRDM